MPEGDTVWYAASRLHQALAGQTLVRSDFRTPRLATVDLVGRSVREVAARGKHLLIRVDGDVTVHSHLGMDGTWRTVTGTTPRGGPAHQMRVLLGTRERLAIGFRLPLLEVLRTGEELSRLGHLGPDLLGPDWDASEAYDRVTAEPQRPLAEALLDQHNLAGIGNIYANELCYLAGASPQTPVGDLPEERLRRLLTVAPKLLEANKDRPLRRTTREQRPIESLWVYGRDQLPCRRCGTTIRRHQDGSPGRERVRYTCPRCQPSPPGGP
ncbi:DNA-formamidopyrimidine glycosylase family protein [Streptomyces sp. NPDC005438]|uniref:DNA-formamidopyrimidine glycosylase family protein n=1 Tax=Streptomyces sp. NPDC005438 TaxID=3156880 RepID=UPI0033A0749E